MNHIAQTYLISGRSLGGRSSWDQANVVGATISAWTRTAKTKVCSAELHQPEHSMISWRAQAQKCSVNLCDVNVALKAYREMDFLCSK